MNSFFEFIDKDILFSDDIKNELLFKVEKKYNISNDTIEKYTICYSTIEPLIYDFKIALSENNLKIKNCEMCNKYFVCRITETKFLCSKECKNKAYQINQKEKRKEKNKEPIEALYLTFTSYCRQKHKSLKDKGINKETRVEFREQYRNISKNLYDIKKTMKSTNQDLTKFFNICDDAKAEVKELYYKYLERQGE